MVKVSILTHLPLEPGCEDYYLLDQAIADFEHGLDSILINTVKTLECDTSFDEPDAMPSSVSSGLFCLLNTISDHSKLQLAPSTKFH